MDYEGWELTLEDIGVFPGNLTACHLQSEFGAGIGFVMSIVASDVYEVLCE